MIFPIPSGKRAVGIKCVTANEPQVTRIESIILFTNCEFNDVNQPSLTYSFTAKNSLSVRSCIHPYLGLSSIFSQLPTS